ncbi:MAG: carboxypeptidase regulatory-like domain-containing protein [Bacteroidales bacterium]|nr:carboxypeptidase regulatory-like domain-containing protein [Bacteroidales bacterium]
MSVSFVLPAQKTLKLGNEALVKEQFSQAINYFEAQINKEKNNQKLVAELSYKIAYCYKRLSIPEMSAPYFQKAVENGCEEELLYLYYGESLQMLQFYDSALVQFQKFERLHPEHSLSQKGLQSIELTQQALANPTRYEVTLKPIINSGGEDYCPFYEARTHKKLYFTSTRNAPTHVTINPESGEYCSNIFVAELDREGKWSEAKILPGNINSTDEEGAACLNRKSNNLYFTRCSYNKNYDKGCRIYVAKKVGNYWTNAQEVEIKGIPDSVSIGHPAISDDELTLYFVADSLLGGYGGKDIYSVSRQRKNQPFNPPQNLGPYINTLEDEVHPYIRGNGDLYFASDGHPGLGGFDIFVAKHVKGSKYDVKNMGYPINTSLDDFGIVFTGMREEGFLSSRRKGGVGKTDLYYFQLPELTFTLSGTIWDKDLNVPIPNVDIQIMNEDYVLMDTQTSDENGRYEVDLIPETNFIIFYKASNYKLEKASVETKGLTETKNFTRDIFMGK